MTIIATVFDEIAKAGDEGLNYHQIKDIQRRIGKSSSDNALQGAVGSIVSRLSKKGMIYTDRTARPYRYKVSHGAKNRLAGVDNGTEPEQALGAPISVKGHYTKPHTKRMTLGPHQKELAFGFDRALTAVAGNFVRELRQIVELEVERRVKGRFREILEGVTKSAGR